jgi:flagellar basal body rod protein FlgB
LLPANQNKNQQTKTHFGFALRCSDNMETKETVGEKVDLSVEMTKLAENQIRYELLPGP